MPHLHEIPVHALHPTQITVGMYEVRAKQRELAAMHPHERRKFLADRPMPAVCSADGRHYIIDHHHLARALWEAGIEHAFITVEAQLPSAAETHFWQALLQKHWAHPINEHGELRPYREIPRHVRQLRDDVYRSLAAFVRAAGGFRKSPTPFAEFQWADWFRGRVAVGATHADFHQAVDKALELAQSPAACALPGFVGHSIVQSRSVE
jgi:hypothetical protein